MQEDDKTQPNPTTPDQLQDAEARQQTTGKKILLIEDEVFITDLYVRALTKAGYEAKVILDGQRGLEEAKTNAYDVILLDIMMPNLTGTDILDTLRSQAQPLKAKIIITTNLEMSKEERAKIEAKADGYLIKADITPKELVAYLDQLQFSQ